MNRFFAPGGEFSLIEKMFPPDRFRRDGRGLGDDAFLLGPWVITADASAENVHYRLDWVSPERALRKALLANLSDLNAMGGRGRHAFLSLGARPEWDESIFAALGRAMEAMETEFDFQVSGGDTLRTSGPSFFAFTVLGEFARGERTGRPLLRSACAPGHRIYVSGFLGGSAAGLRLLQRGEDPRTSKQPEQSLIAAHFDPRPPLQLGPLLASFGKPVGAIDISDGLSSELGHLARQSGCALSVAWEKLPARPELFSILDEAALRACVLHGGEDYPLLFTGDFSASELAQLHAVASIAEIGEVEKGEGVFLAEAGKTSALAPGGFSH